MSSTWGGRPIFTLAFLFGTMFLFFLPVLLYYTIKLYRYRGLMMLKARNYGAVISYNIIVILYLIFNRSFDILGLSHVSFISISDQNKLWTFSLICYPYFGHSLVYLLFYRMYFYFFETNLAINASNDGWKQCINKRQQSHQSWFVNHQSTYGNKFYMGKIILFCYLVSATVSGGTYGWFQFSELLITAGVDALMYSIPVIGIGIVWKWTPLFEDIFYIRDEMRVIVIVGTGLLILYIGINAFLTAIDAGHYASDVVLSPLSVFNFTCLSLVQTAWVFLKLKLDTRGDELERAVLRLQQLRARSISVELSQSTVESSRNEKLLPVLRSEVGYSAFMAHLNSEYSIELLLSYTEFLQFKELLIRNADLLGVTMSEERIRFMDNYKIPNVLSSDMPISECIGDILNIDDWSELNGTQITNELIYNIGQRLFTKYCAVGCAFEINISSRLRAKLSDFFKSESTDIDALFTIYDRCLEEMLFYMRQSFSRFKTNPAAVSPRGGSTVGFNTFPSEIHLVEP